MSSLEEALGGARFVDIWQPERMNESPLHPGEGPDDTHAVHPRRESYPLSRPRLDGGEHARAVQAGLREIVREDRHSVGEYAGKKARATEPHSD